MTEKKSLACSGSASHMVNLEENMLNLKDAETRVTVGESRSLTGTKRGNCHGDRICDRKLHRVTLSNTAVIIGLHTNILCVT